MRVFPKSHPPAFVLFAAFLSLLPGAACADVTPVGVYSNRVVTGGNASGYSIQLWQEGENYFGFFLSSAGLAEDTPLGFLERVRLDANDRSFSFEAKLSVAITTDGQNYVPTRDLYKFTGTLYPLQISGTLAHLDRLQKVSIATSQEIKLYRAKDEDAVLPTFPTYEAWNEHARKLLQSRGPKW